MSSADDMRPPVNKVVSAAAPLTSTSGMMTRTIAKSAASTGASVRTPRICTSPCSIARAGAVIPSALITPPKTNTSARTATSRRRDNQPMPDLRRASASSSTGHTRRHRDVVVRARLHAVEAERAIEVADLGGKKERQLAAAAQRHVTASPRRVGP